MTADRTPAGLSAGGRALWRDVTADHTLDATQRVTLEEACRAKDRLDKLDKILRGNVDRWTTDVYDEAGERYELKIDAALAQANSTANLMKQLIAALRLPDEATGKRPQKRGPRGAYKPGGSSVSSLEKARAAKSS